ncbi:MAG TPA: hypothetical protein VHX65_12785 [Pirellulales bacterium]|nr:hypothetical protein [Pirellulales bacterium]
MPQAVPTEITSPPDHWYSMIEDLFTASVAAIDILCSIQGDAASAETEPSADRFNWVSRETALKMAATGADLVEQLEHRADDDAQAFINREAAAQVAWQLERLVNLGRFPHADRRRGRNGEPATICVAIWKLCERLTELYDLLDWQDVCTDADGPESHTASRGIPWWLRSSQERFRPPDVPAVMIGTLRAAITELARATMHGYPREPVANPEDLLSRLQRSLPVVGTKKSIPDGAADADNLNDHEMRDAKSSDRESEVVLTGPARATFLDCIIDAAKRTVRRGSEATTFGKKERAWALFLQLFRAEHVGMERRQLFAAVWEGQSRGLNNLDKQKQIADEVLQRIGVAVATDNRGVWTLTFFRLPAV